MEIFETTPLDGKRGLRLAGELDSHSVPRFKEALVHLQGDGQTELDLSKLTFIDSSGLHAILEFADAENGHGCVIVEAVPPSLVTLFEISKLTEHPQLEIRVGDGR